MGRGTETPQMVLFGEQPVETVMSRERAMPSRNTFTIPPITKFIRRHVHHGMVSVDPFARNSKSATYTNDLNPETSALHHMEAADFCDLLIAEGVQADIAFFDPPYSPRQISEVYQSVGRKPTTKDTQNAVLYKNVRDRLADIVKPGGLVLSFGWNSVGMGKGRGFELIEVMLVAHGGAHNDTICLAERRVA